MSERTNAGRLRRELRFSRSLLEQNLELVGLQNSEVRPLLDSLMSADGFLGLYGSELLLLEKLLGIGSGVPVVQLVGELISVKPVPADTRVSYGYLASTSKSTNLGLVGLGFSDGIPRSATNKFSVQINGVPVSSLGRIAMDQCVVDLGDANPEVGSEVHFFSESYPLSHWARDSGFTELEILGRIAARVTRTWTA
jgi:alanine racemase